MLFLDTVIQCKTDFPQAECMKQKEFIAIPWLKGTSFSQ